MDEDLQVTAALVIPATELSWTASRSGGPGGQHVNKTSSKVTLRWALAESTAVRPDQMLLLEERLGNRITSEGALVVHVESERSQLRNRQLARAKLAELVAAALHVDKPRKRTRVSRAAKKRRVEAKRRRGEKKALRKKPKLD